MDELKVCVVEDQALLLKTLSQVLDATKGIARAGSFPNAEAALREMDWGQVDILLADIDLPGMSGVELIRRVKTAAPAIDCMAFTVYEDRSTVFAAIQAGACGYLLKGCPPEELVEALRELHEGGSPMSPRVARKLLQELQATPVPVDRRPAPNAGELLTARELEVLKQVEQGLSYKEVAQALNLSTHTVHGHLKRIYEKFQAHGGREAVAKARKMGVL